MGKTTKPCPGCLIVYANRQADRVCHVCQRKINEVDEIRADAERVKATVANTLKVQTKPRTVMLPARCYFSVGERMLTAPEWTSLVAATAKLIHALTEPLDRGRQPSSPRSGSDALPTSTHSLVQADEFHGYVEASDAAITEARRWWHALSNFARACHASGVEDGRDLLGQLAAGTMTAGQVNEKALEIARNRRDY